MADLSLHTASHLPFAGAFAAFGHLLHTWRQRARERDELAALDARTLRDLGVAPSYVEFEINKPFWRG